jgi:hypothetical protein
MGEKGIEPGGSLGTGGGPTYGAGGTPTYGAGGTVGGLPISAHGTMTSIMAGPQLPTGGSTPPPPPEGPSTGETVVDVVETVLDPVGSVIKKLF